MYLLVFHVIVMWYRSDESLAPLDIAASEVEALEDCVFGAPGRYEELDVNLPAPGLSDWLVNRLLVESSLRDARILKAGGAAPMTADAVSSTAFRPLLGVVKIDLNLKQRMAALAVLREERDAAFLRDRAQYVCHVFA
jgi:hypothetical protein